MSVIQHCARQARVYKYTDTRITDTGDSESAGTRSVGCREINRAGEVRRGTRHSWLMTPLMKWLISLDICREIISHNAPRL